MNNGEDFIPPKRLPGKEIVQCPITAKPDIRSVVTLEYCKGCDYFVKYLEDADRVECKYPRIVEVISVYGEKTTT